MKTGGRAKLPVLVSIPHGGTGVPPELTDRIRIGPDDVLADGDAFTGEIYDVSDCVTFQIRAEVARAFVDLNRAEDDRPGVELALDCHSIPSIRCSGKC